MQPFYWNCIYTIRLVSREIKYSKSKDMMKKNYEKPLVVAYEVMSERGFIQSDFNSGFDVPGGGNNGGEDEWV